MNSAGRSTGIKAVLFDKDGTLFDFHSTWLPILRDAALLAARGNAALVTKLMALGGHDADRGRIRAGSLLAAGDTIDLATCWLPHVHGWQAEELINALDRLYTQNGPASAVPVTELVPFFSRLRGEGLRLGLATNDTEAAARATMDRFGIARHFDFLSGYDSGHGSKPSPGMVQAFCRTVNVAPQAVAVVGDNIHDLEMGHAGGVGLIVGVLTGTSSRDDLDPRADAVIDSIADLPALLARFRLQAPR
ncbi:MAG: HAD-IA family hydrolase [Rhizobiales bacterium]|nr:HAD-IA family hydrolase [Hyphomicrobiales bacterium]